ncbi:MAG TPA: OB-fold nucleic acid binding domain-containing protein [Jiangellales bacterium]|nr:OB-fold nucleic acid binding domain-containing protein [Jiangellales bacterium]
MSEQPGGPGRFRRALSRLTSPESEMDAAALRDRSRTAGCVSLADCSERQRARVRGTLRTVTLQPRAGTPALEAELYDGSGTLTLVWLGRRRIAGIDCGRRLVAEGRIATVDGRPVIFNPAYDLLPTGQE